MRSPLLAALLAAACLGLSACTGTPLYSTLDEQQANEIESALLESGIDADKHPTKKSEEWSVEVAKHDVPQAMAVLAARGLPRPSPSSMGEVFEKKGFVSSPLEERARYLYALSQELSRTLMQLDGVISARVHIALPEKDALGESHDSASASVVIIHDEKSDVASRETDIKAIVTDGVEGLNDVNRVTVKFFPRAALKPAASGGSHLAAGPGAASLRAPDWLGGAALGAGALVVVGLALVGILRRRGAGAATAGGA